MAWNSGYQLRILKGNQQGLVVPLTEQVYILGRATSQGETAPGYMFFYEPTVSRVHAVFKWRGEACVLSGVGSNPIVVNGLVLDGERELETGDTLLLSESVELVFEQGEAP